MNQRLEAMALQPQATLEGFTEEEKEIIQWRLHVLTSLAYYISKDYKMGVELNQRGAGWHWDFDNNVVRADPEDLLTKPMEFLQFVMSHEAGHRRISRVKGVIPDEVWELPAYSFMSNVIEDPRDNNFVADTIPHFEDQMKYAYDPEFNGEDVQFEEEMKAEAMEKFGKEPRFMEAGFEYLRIWYRERTGKEATLREDLRPEVREVVERTLLHARKSWNTYPSSDEADNGLVVAGKQLSGEETIMSYARSSFRTNYRKIWPLFKKLVDMDIEDATKNRPPKNENKEPSTGNLPSQPADLPAPPTPKDDANDEEKNKRKEEHGGPKNEQKKEGGTPGDTQEPGADKPGNQSVPPGEPLTQEEATRLIKEFGDKLAKHFQGKHIRVSDEESDKGDSGAGILLPGVASDEEDKDKKYLIISAISGEKDSPEELRSLAIKQEAQRFESKEFTSLYENTRKELAPLIDELTFQLQEIFNKRRHTRWKDGFKSGKRINIGKVIQEEVTETSPFETKAFMRREQPLEIDYAIKLLFDLSGSMQEGGKIDEAFKAAVVLMEALNTIGVSFSVDGFHTLVRSYKSFGSALTDKERSGTEEFFSEIYKPDAYATYDGYALEQTADEMKKVEQTRKIVLTVSDGKSSQPHVLKEAVAGLVKNKVKVIGLGLGKGTEHVEMYYPTSVANISVHDLVKVLAKKLVEAIEAS
jgi:hypothetical protein